MTESEDRPIKVCGVSVEKTGLRGHFFSNYPLSKITWMRVGGPAELLFQPADEDDLRLFLERLPLSVPVFTMGLGSNLLVRDGGVAGVVIRMTGKGLSTCSLETPRLLRVGAALPLRKLAEKACLYALGGFAFYVGIPGSVGGALRMNAGAHGGETRERLCSVRAVDRSGNVHTLSTEEMHYAYRFCGADSALIFTEGVFQGEPSSQECIQQEMARILEEREATQPVREKTGGSTFKNPPDAKAWHLIDMAGCRGLTRNEACISEKHCNFLINKGSATAADLESLAEEVRARVQERLGIILSWEVVRVGRLPTERK